MVRIAGIEKDLTPLELLFVQAEPNEKLELASGYIAQLANELGDLELKVTMGDDSVIIISAKLNQLKEKGE